MAVIRVGALNYSVVLLMISSLCHSDSGMAVGHSIVEMHTRSTCNVIRSQKINYGNGYQIKVHAVYHSGKQLSTSSFGRDKDHALSKFLCKYNASEMKSFKYHTVK